MGAERFIHEHLPYQEAGEHRHTGMRSHLRGLASAMDQIRDWRMQRVASHERGFHQEDLIPPDEEIVLFFPIDNLNPISDNESTSGLSGGPTAKGPRD